MSDSGGRQGGKRCLWIALCALVALAWLVDSTGYVVRFQRADAGREKEALTLELRATERLLREARSTAEELRAKVNEGYEVVKGERFVLLYPPALNWLTSKDDESVRVLGAHAEIEHLLGKFQRAAKVRIMTTKPPATGGFLTSGRFIREEDEIIVWPSGEGLSHQALVHEFCHAWVFQKFGADLPLALEEGVAYAASRINPEEMFERLRKGGGAAGKDALWKAPATAADRRLAEATAWLVVYYLECVQGMDLKDILRIDPAHFPEPREIFDAAWAYHRLLMAPPIASNPFASRWLELAEVGPLTDMELKRFDAKNEVLQRKLEATRELLFLGARRDRNIQQPKPYARLKDLRVAETWRRNKGAVYEEMFRFGTGACLLHPYGVSLRHLTLAAIEPLVPREEFVESEPGLRLRARCEATIWAQSVRSIFCEGEAFDPYGSSSSLNLEMNDLRLLAVTNSLGRLTAELRRRPLSLLKLR